MNHTLHSRASGQGPDVLLLHGLFGQGTNLRSVARALEPEFRVHGLDLPDHGQSLWLSDASLPAYAACVSDWMADHGIDHAHVIGHSLGGKVAMELALTAPSKLGQLVVADIAPVAYPRGHQAIIAALEAVQSSAFRSRADAEAILRESIEDPGVIGYLLMSLKAEAGVYQWRFNLEGLAAAYSRLGEAPSDTGEFAGPSLFLRGAQSSYVLPEHEDTIKRRFPASALVTIDRAGHWLHVDQPQTFNQQVRDFLSGI